MPSNFRQHPDLDAEQIQWERQHRERGYETSFKPRLPLLYGLIFVVVLVLTVLSVLLFRTL
ncbi:hypothetical protein EPA93_36190 [Ktedonosporobacter rubrisoli]|uniref:Uncharacterized protein n=1 Tax=Ktedonosporobacter rubrisoli TaxID=2509675 RepID=A0A4P6K014_KTERU|nr:hypothetical protein [Ktedonosporobacter rubrisoli]QBD81123.1 hypothetical protein EPA93_36190 [Ktedonosporobacter rubrisoli]